MAKPGTLYSWGAATIVAPTSGHQASGWVPSEIPGANETNTLLNNWATWLTYVQGADLELTGVEFDATTYTFSTTSVNDVDFSGVGSLNEVGYVILGTSTSGPYEITGIAGSVPGKILVVQNRTVDPVTFANSSSSSLSGNRLHFADQDSPVIPPFGSILLIGCQTVDSVHGWLCVGQYGQSGRYLGMQKFISSGTYTPTAGATKCRVRLVGGGGGGGGCAAGTGPGAATGGGGASGVYVEQFIDGGGVQITGGTVTIGAGGNGGIAGNNSGGTGGDTAVTINGTTYTGKGGGGGGGGANGGAGVSCGNPGTVTLGTAYQYQSGGQGLPGIGNAGAGTGFAFGGSGGSNPLGWGGQGAITSSAGAEGAGTGSGGGGGGDVSAGIARAGGSGLQGIVLIDEWT